MALNSPWAILRCKWNDIADEPLSDAYVRNMFTTAGAGTLNMVDFFDKMSHGKLDLSGSQVFGWFTLPKPHTDYAAYGGSMTRRDLVKLALATATTHGVPLNNFPHQVVLMNHQTDLFGGLPGSAAVCDSTNCMPSNLGQEMGHPYGLQHSWGARGEYGDPWDIMSTACFGWTMGANGPYGLYGPGLNAANMRLRGWLDRSRVLALHPGNGSFPSTLTVQLRPLHARELPGYLALEVRHTSLEIDDCIIEFRDNRGWDSGWDLRETGPAAVFVHSFFDGSSYLERNKNGAEELHAGDSWELGAEDLPESPYTHVLVEEIDAANRVATLTITHRPGRGFNVPIGGDLRLRWVDGGGFLGGSARQSVVVQPGDDLVEVVDHLVAFKSVESLRDGPARDAVQRAAMEQLGQYAEAQLGRLNADNIRTPAPLSPDRKLERPSYAVDSEEARRILEEAPLAMYRE